jgi:hypothetical protein
MALALPKENIPCLHHKRLLFYTFFYQALLGPFLTYFEFACILQFFLL